MSTAALHPDSFPSVCLRWSADRLPVEVMLIDQLEPGAGDRLIATAGLRQSRHPAFVDALDEPSARLASMHPELADPTSVYSFLVGPTGHPFHRHAGHRAFTAVSGSAGAQLRFAVADDDACAADPQAFLRALRIVEVPADALFVVRFGGGTWHQFVPSDGAAHPALFALSFHSNELGGTLTEKQQDAVRGNRADIPALTELLPAPMQRAWSAASDARDSIPTTRLTLGRPVRATPRDPSTCMRKTSGGHPVNRRGAVG